MYILIIVPYCGDTIVTNELNNIYTPLHTKKHTDVNNHLGTNYVSNSDINDHIKPKIDLNIWI